MAGLGRTIVLSRLDAARVLGCSPRTFERLVAQGVAVPLTTGTRGAPSTFDAVALVQAYLAYRDTLAGHMDANTERARLAAAQRERIELELATKRGQLAPVAEFEEAAQLVAHAVREQLLGVAAAAVAAGLVQPRDEAKVDALVRAALQAVAAKAVA